MSRSPGRADLRATATRIRRDYAHLFRDDPTPRTAARAELIDELEQARVRVVGRRSARAQLQLDLTNQREDHP